MGEFVDVAPFGVGVGGDEPGGGQGVQDATALRRSAGEQVDGDSAAGILGTFAERGQAQEDALGDVSFGFGELVEDGVGGAGDGAGGSAGLAVAGDGQEFSWRRRHVSRSAWESSGRLPGRSVTSVRMRSASPGSSRRCAAAAGASMTVRSSAAGRRSHQDGAGAQGFGEPGMFGGAAEEVAAQRGEHPQARVGSGDGVEEPVAGLLVGSRG